MPLKVVATASDSERHLEDVESLIFHQGKLYSGGDEGKIKVWDANLHLLDEFQAHPVGVSHIEAAGEALYSCSSEGGINEWTSSNGNNGDMMSHWELKRKMTGVIPAAFTRIRASEGRLFGGDEYGGVGVWEDGMLVCVYSLVEEVWDLHVDRELLYSVRDKDVVITKMMPGASHRYCTKATMEGRGPMCVVDDKLCFVTRDGMGVHVHRDGHDFCRLSTLKGHELIVKALCGENGKLFSSGWDGTVIQWDLGSSLPNDSLKLDVNVNVLCQGPSGRVFAAGSGGMLCALQNTTP